MVMPNFLIIGAAKAGTTSLCYYLNQHPEIYISLEKEPRYFCPEIYTTFCNGPLRDGARRSIVTLEEYQKLFAGATDEVALGEASTEYMYFPETPNRIKQAIPDIRLIAILRNPVERAFSAFCYQLRDGCEDLSFEQALEDEARRIENCWRPGWLYKNAGFYYRQLVPYFEIFERHQIRIYLYEDLDKHLERTLRDICLFLEVNPNFSPDLSRQNVSKIPKNRLLNNLVKRNNSIKTALKWLLPAGVQNDLSHWIRQYNLSVKPTLLDEWRYKLMQSYYEDIKKLEELIDRDLSQWLM